MHTPDAISGSYAQHPSIKFLLLVNKMSAAKDLQKGAKSCDDPRIVNYLYVHCGSPSELQVPPMHICCPAVLMLGEISEHGQELANLHDSRQSDHKQINSEYTNQA
jgi:hypothetical protein